MEIVNLIFIAENIRFIVLLAAIYFFNRETKFELRDEIRNVKNELRSEMDEKLTAFHKQLKENDFAHLEKTIKALTYMLEKNKFLTVEDKGFIDSHLEN